MKKKEKDIQVERFLLYFFTKELGGGFSSKNRNYKNVRDRRLICKFLSEKGFSKVQISRVIKQPHSLVYHLLNEVIDYDFSNYYHEKTAKFEEKFERFYQENLKELTEIHNRKVKRYGVERSI